MGKSKDKNKKNNYKSKSNIYLLIKQGTRGIYKYRVQFWVIIILSFIASSFFTAAWSTNVRLKSNYNDFVTNKTEKFDYSYTYSVDKSGVQRDELSYAPTLDIAPEYNNLSGLGESATSLNLIYASAGSAKANNVFDVFRTAAAKKMIKDNAKYMIAPSQLNILYNPAGNIRFDMPSDIESFPRFFSFDRIFDVTPLPNSSNEQVTASTNNYPFSSLLADNITKFLTNNDNKEQLKKSVIGRLQLKHAEEQKTTLSNTKITVQLQRYINLISRNFTDYLSGCVSRFVYDLVSRSITALQNSKTIAKQTPAQIKTWLNEEMNTEVINVWKKNHPKQTPPAELAAPFQVGVINSEDSKTSSLSDDQVNSFIEFAYQYIFGERLNDSDDAYNKFVISQDNPQFITDAVKNKDQITENNTLLSADDIWIKGFRGMINPIIWHNSSDPKGTTPVTTSLDKLDILEIETPFYNFNQSNEYSPNFDVKYKSGEGYTNLTISSRFYITEQNPYEWMFNQHQAFVGEVNNFKVHLRNELFTFDNQTQTSQRIVFMDSHAPQKSDDDTSKLNEVNLNIIKGSMPVSSLQVAVSPQYARHHHLNVGDTIEVGSAIEVVSAIATDPYSYYPTGDPNNPLPNASKTAVIYAMQSSRLAVDSSRLKPQTDAETSFFLTSNSTNSTQKEKDIANYEAMMMSRTLKLNYSIDYYQGNDASITSDFIKNTCSKITVDGFLKSNFRYSWTLLPLGLTSFETFSLAFSAVIALITLVSCYISVKRTIERNASQIAILKALGVSKFRICLPYLAYPILISTIIIPLGWISGIVLQWPISEIFQTFFSANYNMILIDYQSILILLATLGLFALFVSLASALIIVRRNVIEIINPNGGWKTSGLIMDIKNRYFSNAKFSTRFRMQILSSSSKKIWVMSGMVFLSTMLITLSISLPAVLKTVSSSFFSNINYKNSFNYREPVYNVPLSKSQISEWNGPDALEKDFGEDIGPVVNGKQTSGYKNIMDYFAASLGTKVFPLYEYRTYKTEDNNNLKTDFNFTLQDITSDYLANDSSMIPKLLDWFGNNMYVALGQGFSTSNINAILQWINESPSFNASNESEKNQIIQNINSSLDTGVCQILATVLSSKEPPKGATWQSCVADQILTQVPPYVKKYSQSSESRTQQFTFGWNFNLVQPDKEVLSTTASGEYNYIKNDKKLSVPINALGLTKDDEIISTQDSTSGLYATNDVYDKIQKVLTDYETSGASDSSKISFNNELLYDPATKTLSIPVIANKQAEGIFDTRSGLTSGTISTYTPQLKFLNTQGTYSPVLKQFWTYDDTDYRNWAQSKGYDNKESYKESDVAGEKHYYLDPYSLNNNKFTFKDNFKDPSQDNPNDKSVAFAFPKNYINEQGQPFLSPRTYYEYKNLQLFLPGSLINPDLYENPLSLKTHNTSDYWKQVPATDVPDSVKVGKYANEKNWYRVLPYDLNYDPRYGNSGADGALGNLLSQMHSWFGDAEISPNKILNFDNNNSPIYGDLKIKYNVIGTSNTYGNTNVYTSNKFANLINGFSTNSYYQLNPNIEKTPDGKLNVDTASAFEKATRISNRSPSEMWYNTKYSQAEEPYDLTTYFADTVTQKTGYYGITFNAANDVWDHGNIVARQNLLSAKIGLVRNLTAILMSVAAIMIFLVVSSSVLLILMISNLFVSQYERFMTLMKTEGYNNKQIASYTVGVFTPFVAGFAILGAAVALLLIYIGYLIVLNRVGFVIPFELISTWWVVLAAFAIVGLLYSTTFVFTFHKLNNNTAADLLRSDNIEG